MNNPEKCWLHKVATLSQHPPAILPYYNQICFHCVQSGQINLNESAVKNLKVNIKNNIKNLFNYVCLMLSIQSVGINVIDLKVESRSQGRIQAVYYARYKPYVIQSVINLRNLISVL